MITTPRLIDTNVWLALVFDKHPAHAIARQVFEAADSSQPIAFCRSTQQSFLRLVTTPALHKLYDSPPITNDQAWEKTEQLLALPQVIWLNEPHGLSPHWLNEPHGLSPHWQKYAHLPSASPKVWMDGYLAAFARAHAITLVTLDKDFKNFSGLTLRYLL